MENLTLFFIYEFVGLILVSAIFIYIIINKIHNSFVKGIFFIAYPLFLINKIFIILMSRLNLESNLFGWEGKIGFIYITINMFAFFLFYYLLTLLFGRDISIQDSSKEMPRISGERRNLGISLLLFIVTLGIYYPFWLYRTVKDLRTNFEKDIPYTPGKAVGFLFIPIFNIFWGIYLIFSIPLKIKQVEEKYINRNIGFYFHPVLISIFFILFPIIAYLPTYNTQLIIAKIIFSFLGHITLLLTIQAKLNCFFDIHNQ